MIKFVGFLIVISSVLGGYVLSHGELLTLWQPFELLIIGGSALGAFIVANPMHVVKEVFKAVFHSLLGRRYGRRAMASISTSAPLGRAPTCTAERAGYGSSK